MTSATDVRLSSVGCVVIGRNEGDRLRECLESIAIVKARCVYVDSGSVDGSPDLARSLGFDVHELDPARPFTAARGRNEGFARLRDRHPEVQFVQFIDGDCAIDPAWLTSGAAELVANDRLAVTVGRARERRRDDSIYNQLADIEWQSPVGEISACGGVAMIRASALEAAGGYREDLIAGEEPEMCLRLREAGWRLESLDAEMMTHDLAMHRFSQWWRRAVRSGYAYVQGQGIHPHFRRGEVRRIVFWGGVVPSLILVSLYPTAGLSGLLALLYAKPLHGAFRHARARGNSLRDSLLYGGFCTVGKFAEFVGVLRYGRDRASGRAGTIIEHKAPLGEQERDRLG